MTQQTLLPGFSEEQRKRTRLRRRISALLLAVLLLAIPAIIYLPAPPEPRIAGPFPVPPPALPADDLFPVSPSLQPQIDFWARVFTQHSRSEALIHDDWYVGVVYEVVDLKGAGKNRWNVIREVREKYRKILADIAEDWDSPGTLTGEARRVRRLFKDLPESSRFPHADAHQRVRAQIGQADSFKKGIVWSGRYLDQIKQILAEYDVPEALAYLPLIESAYNPFSYSHVGAAGMWQLMPQTGKQHKLRVDNMIDERRDPILATRAAARHLAINYRTLKNWPLAITAYNHGLQGMINAVRAVGSTDMGKLVEHYDGSRFAFASRNFYAEFVVAVAICSEPEKYFGDIGREPALALEQIGIPDHIAVSTLEKYCGVTADEIRTLNPALLPSVFRSGGMIPKGYRLNLPAERKAGFETAYAAIPATLKFQESLQQQYYRVRRGQTLSQIASRFNVSTRNLARANGIRNPRWIRAGQRLRIPGRYVAVSSPRKTSSTIKPDQLRNLRHKVLRGETLSEIAEQYGISTRSIARHNEIRNLRKIRAGQVLRIPEG